MGIRFECPKCGKHLSAGDDYAGKQGKCKCGTALIVPGELERIGFRCDKCGGGISVQKAHAGKRGRCPTCKGEIAVPLLGKLLGAGGGAAKASVAAAATVPAEKSAGRGGTIRFDCRMCGGKVEASEGSAGNIVECPGCGCYVEAPGAKGAVRGGGAGPGREAGSRSAAAGKAEKGALSSGKTVCPSCLRKLADGTPVCTHCGIYLKSGRPILTAWDVDEDELEEKANAIVGVVSWIVPFGIYPVYSEAMGNHRPYATWGIGAVTVLVSLWFLAIMYAGSPKMQSAKNLMLWGGGAKPSGELIDALYEYTNYGDAGAFEAKRRELRGTVPDAELNAAAVRALSPEERCFGEYRHSQLITHALLHGGILHLVGNMLFLFVLGSRVNAAIGNILTVILYPVLAIAAAVTYLITLGSELPTAMLGASGAVMGLAGMYLLLFPIHKVYMVIWLRWGLLAAFRLSFKCFAVRGFWVVLFYIMFDIIAVSLTLGTGTAHWAHIGGIVWGMALALVLLVGRLAYSRSDMLSLVLGKYAWRAMGTPASRLK